MPTPRQRLEHGPTTLAEVHAARNGNFRSERLSVAERPLLFAVDERGTPQALGHDAEIRAAVDGERTREFVGHASTYDQEYEMWGGPPYGWIEEVSPGAGKKSLAEGPDVVFLVNHEGLPLARTASGTLRISEDSVGLLTEADLNIDDPDVVGLVPKMERGDLTEMSFAFRIVRQEWDEEYQHRWITEYSIERGDVSIVTFGANPNTDATLRAADLLAASGGDPSGQILAAIRHVGASDEAALLDLRARIDGLLGDVADTERESSEGMGLATARLLYDIL